MGFQVFALESRHGLHAQLHELGDIVLIHADIDDLGEDIGDSSEAIISSVFCRPTQVLIEPFFDEIRRLVSKARLGKSPDSGGQVNKSGQSRGRFSESAYDNLYYVVCSPRNSFE